MELNELLKENEDALFEEFLAFPTITHALDRRRFVRYAIVARNNCSGLNQGRIDALLAKGMNKQDIDKLQNVYEWMDDVLEVLR